MPEPAFVVAVVALLLAVLLLGARRGLRSRAPEEGAAAPSETV